MDKCFLTLYLIFNEYCKEDEAGFSFLTALLSCIYNTHDKNYGFLYFTTANFYEYFILTYEYLLDVFKSSSNINHDTFIMILFIKNLEVRTTWDKLNMHQN